MAKRRPPTLHDLLVKNGESLDAFAIRAGVPRFTLYRLREGLIRKPRITTLQAVAAGLKLDVAVVEAACKASFAQRAAD